MSDNGKQSAATVTCPGRWKPSRSGLINFYRYDNQEFNFHDGRLLLRGNNGTGKSRVLALQLPFLLDGDTSPERMEPDGDKAKRFEWNLLMGKHDDRLGYTWIEFERLESDGTAQYVTLGCGARAASGRGVVAKWFFTTQRRVGHDLSLCSSQNNPLPKDSLIDALGAEGHVFTTASGYREEVNRLLYGLPQERYEALIKLLIELRQPKLSRNLDEKTLSLAMSDSLPPVSPRMIQQVSEAMRAMEQDRTALANLKSAKESTDAFLTEYRRYARIIACRRAGDVTKAHSNYELRQRKLRDSEKDQTAATEKLDQLGTEEKSLALTMTTERSRKATLENSPQMRSARELEAARKNALDRRADAKRLSDEHEQSVIVLKRANDECAVAQEQVQTAAALLSDKAGAAERHALACELDTTHRGAVARMGMPHPSDLEAIEGAERFLQKAYEGRREGSRILRRLNGEIERSEQARQKAYDRRESEAGRLGEARTVLQERRSYVAESVHRLSARYKTWFDSVLLLTPAAPEDISLAIGVWQDERFAANGPVRKAVDEARHRFATMIAAERAEKITELKAHERATRELEEERDRLLSGKHQPPPVPHTRDADSRTDRPGTPLWRVCEFVEGVPESDRAGLEAALESAGVLDAWITPDGRIEASGAWDTFLHGAKPAGAGRDLLGVLRPTASENVAINVVESVLRAIGLGEGNGDAWVEVTGRWQLGVLSGRWSKPVAQHIGEAAREAARKRRLGELHAKIEEMRHIMEIAREALQVMMGKSRAAEAEADRAPAENEVRVAVAALDAQQAQVSAAELLLVEADAALVSAKGVLDRQITDRHTTATDLGLLNWIHRVQALDDTLGDYREALAGLWPAARDVVRTGQSLNAATGRVEQEQGRTAKAEDACQDAAQKAAAAKSQYDTLHQNVGVTTAAVQQQLGAVEATIEELDRKQKKNIGDIAAAQQRIESLQQLVQELKEGMKEETERRSAAIGRLLHFTQTALIDITDDALVGVGREEMAVSSAVDLARRISSTLAEVVSDDGAWDGTQKVIYNHIQNLTNALQSHDYRPETRTDGDMLVITAPLHGMQRPMREFSQLLAEEIVNRRALLSAKELELLENYLIQDVAVEMGKLIREAETLVIGMNAQLLARANSTGMALRFHWEPDAEGPAAFATARKKLLGDQATWSPSDRTALGQFLQEQINRARETNAAGTWLEQLSAALDYRLWHRFHVERRQENKWQRLTRKTHGTGSGGEKAIALTIPQFAAAAAYYDSAASFAPRLILLDEAFVGIDSDMRGKCMGLLHEFDLDFVMTSEREWGCYRSMPGLAIYQLSAREGIDAVWASRFVWNGRERVRQDVISPNPTAPSVPGNGLFNAESTERAT